jgi:hypothetical protein
MGIISVDFRRVSSVGRIVCIRPKFEGGKKRQYSETVPQILLDFKKVYDSVRREVLYNILVESGIPMKLLS